MNSEQQAATVEELQREIVKAADGFVMPIYALQRLAVAIERQPGRMAELLARFLPNAVVLDAKAAAPFAPDEQRGNVVAMASGVQKSTPTRVRGDDFGAGLHDDEGPRKLIDMPELTGDPADRESSTGGERKGKRK